MKNISRKIATVILVLVSALAAFAQKPQRALNVAESFKVGASNFGIPAAVLDPNFRAWQPPHPVPVMPCQINDIMMTDGRVICYNPYIVNQVPPKIQAFFLAHEYGHIYGQTSSEFAADQFAARTYAQTDIGVVRAAIWHFYNMQGNSCDNAHGCGWQRAINIGQTAGFSQAEIQSIIAGNV